jgi:hypothetical protein
LGIVYEVLMLPFFVKRDPWMETGERGVVVVWPRFGGFGFNLSLACSVCLGTLSCSRDWVVLLYVKLMMFRSTRIYNLQQAFCFRLYIAIVDELHASLLNRLSLAGQEN